MHIVTRSRGTKKYFYLKHSTRINGNVVTKEQYIGCELPATIAVLQQQFLKTFKLPLYEKFDAIRSHFQKEWNTIPSVLHPKEMEELAILFTYNTNAIEGSTITLDETRAIIQQHLAPHKSLRDIHETESNVKVFLHMLSTPQDYSLRLLLGWHRELFGETKPELAGHWREHLVRVGDYIAPDWQDVQTLMRKFIVDLKKEGALHPVELAARVHYRFEKIHPFGDGNGRIGRLLLNSILWHHGYPLLIIEYRKRLSYYKAFRNDEEYFVRYFFRRYLAAHQRRLIT